MPQHSARRRWFGWVLAAAFVGFAAFVVWRSLHVAGFRCEVCITFHDREACRTVDGQTEREALAGAVTNACALLASGVTDSIACERTTPTKAECQALD